MHRQYETDPCFGLPHACKHGSEKHRFELCATPSTVQQNMCDDDIEILQAIIAEALNPTKELGVSVQGSAPVPNTSDHSDRPACVFFQQGNCARGASCRFAHSLSADPIKCKNFVSGNCRFGSACRYSHQLEERPPNQSIAARPTLAVNVTEAAATLWPSPSISDQYDALDNILLLGEGNFKFAWALGQALPHVQILATSYQSSYQRVIDSHPQCFALDALSNGALSNVAVLYGVDACALDSNSKLHRDTSSPFTKVVWNFPFTGTDEDEEAHMELMRQMFASLGRSCLRADRFLDSTCIIRLGLQGDQFSRWHVQQIARAHFFFLDSVWEFDLNEYPGYSPVRNLSSDSFPVQRPRYYNFRFRHIELSQLQSNVITLCSDLTQTPFESL